MRKEIPRILFAIISGYMLHNHKLSVKLRRFARPVRPLLVPRRPPDDTMNFAPFACMREAQRVLEEAGLPVHVANKHAAE